MKPPDKKFPHANVARQRPARPTPHARQFKPTVAQSKSAVAQQKSATPAHASRHTAAAPVYRPQSKPPVAQRKTAVASQPQTRTPPAAPPVYRPQPAPVVLQRKTHAPLQPVCQTKQATAPHAPHVHNVARAKPRSAFESPSETKQTIAPRAAAPTRATGFSNAARTSNVILRSKVSPRSVIQLAAESVCEICGGPHSWKKCSSFAEDAGAASASDDGDEKKKKKRAKSPPKKKEEKEMSFGVSKIAPKVRPPVGNVLTDLNGIDKFNFPDVYLATMINISTPAASANKLNVDTKGRTLPGGKGSVSETIEYKVSLTGAADRFVVIHYHPNAVIPKGALSGESKLHLKGAGTKGLPHTSISMDTIAALGITL